MSKQTYLRVVLHRGADYKIHVVLDELNGIVGRLEKPRVLFNPDVRLTLVSSTWEAEIQYEVLANADLSEIVGIVYRAATELEFKVYHLSISQENPRLQLQPF